MQLNKDIVERVVIRAFLDRGLQPRKGAKIDVLLGDYASALEGIPEKALEAAVRDVIRDWEFPGWPTTGAIRKAAARYTTLPEEEGTRSESKDPELSRRNKKAYDYARSRLLANNGELLLRLMGKGPWLRQQIEKFLVERAQEQLKGGALDAHVRNDDLEAEIASLIAEQEARTQSQSALASSQPRTNLRKPPIESSKVQSTSREEEAA